MAEHAVMEAAHSALLAGLRAQGSGESKDAYKGDTMVVELKQSLEDRGQLPATLGVLCTHSFNIVAAGHPWVVRACFIDLHNPKLGKRHSRLLAFVENADVRGAGGRKKRMQPFQFISSWLSKGKGGGQRSHKQGVLSIVPHLYVEVVSSRGQSATVHADLINRLPSERLPDTYEDVSLTLQSHVVATARRQTQLDATMDPPERPHPIIGCIPSSGDPVAAVIKVGSLEEVFGPSLKALVVQWLDLIDDKALYLEPTPELCAGLEQREKQFHAATFNPDGDLLAGTIRELCGNDVLPMIRSTLEIDSWADEDVDELMEKMNNMQGKQDCETGGSSDSQKERPSVTIASGEDGKAEEESDEERVRKELKVALEQMRVEDGEVRGEDEASQRKTEGRERRPEGEETHSDVSSSDHESSRRSHAATEEGGPAREGGGAAAHVDEVVATCKAQLASVAGGGEGVTPRREAEGSAEQPSEADARDMACVGAMESIADHDSRSRAMTGFMAVLTVPEMQAKDKMQAGPFAGGRRSISMRIHNITALPLVLGSSSIRACSNWVVPPPLRIRPGEEGEVCVEAHGGITSLANGSVKYQCDFLGETVAFEISWEWNVGAWLGYAGLATNGWRVERDYLQGQQGIHVTTSFFLTRALPPEIHLRASNPFAPAESTLDRTGSSSSWAGEAHGDVPLRMALLDTGLDMSMGSRFHATSERAKHIASWLQACSEARSRDVEESAAWQLDLVVLQGVHAEHGRRELLQCFATQHLGLSQVFNDYNPLKRNIVHPSGSSGVLVASKFPVRFSRWLPFPRDATCTHPAVAVAASQGGVQAVLLDLESVAKGHFLLLLVAAMPSQPAVWKSVYTSLNSCLGDIKAVCADLSNVAVLLCGKFEGFPELPDASFRPRDLMTDPRLGAVPATLAEVQEQEGELGGGLEEGGDLPRIPANSGTLTSSKLPYTWDPLHNALAASCNDVGGHWKMPCRSSCISALDWLVSEAPPVPAASKEPVATAAAPAVRRWWEGLMAPREASDPEAMLAAAHAATREEEQAEKKEGEAEGEAARDEADGKAGEAKGEDGKASEAVAAKALHHLVGVQGLHQSVHRLGVAPTSQPADHSAVLATVALRVRTPV